MMQGSKTEKAPTQFFVYFENESPQTELFSQFCGSPCRL